MSKTYSQLVKQIETLKQEAEKLRKQEISDVVKRIREAIDFYGLTAADLGLGAGAKPVAKVASKRAAKTGKAAKSTKSTLPAKFRDENGNTWGGRGKRPQWLRDALAAGKTLSDFAIK
jgi:DNA-binding protein H-NS